MKTLFNKRRLKISYSDGSNPDYPKDYVAIEINNWDSGISLSGKSGRAYLEQLYQALHHYLYVKGDS